LLKECWFADGYNILPGYTFLGIWRTALILLKIIYWLGLVGQIVIRYPYRNNPKSGDPNHPYESRTEKVLLWLLSAALIPALIYTFTGWLDFANYRLSDWMGWLGAAILAGGLFVFWRAHTDLSSYWSPTLEIYKDHKLVTSGIYRTIRHPMYASQWLFVIAQCLILQNWIAGPVNLIIFIPFYILRVQAEENMLLKTFGEEYRIYREQTGSVIPRFRGHVMLR
jgi:protein-S-isoprenylcysteine O-methyltransferase Ste14